jgi:ribonuclease T2
MDKATVRRMFCRTPSAELLQHEWQAHGACGWTAPAAYFRRAAALYDRIVLPRMETIAPEALSAGAVRRAFIARNPALRPEGVMVAGDAQGRLTEVRLCYDLAFRPAACPGGLAPADAVRFSLTPSRSRGF